MEKASIKIIQSLNLEGGCNIQFAYKNGVYKVIEVNPRVSRSSALASKVTGFPIAKYSAKIALGIPLTNLIKNIKKGSSDNKISIEHVVVKFPKWNFDKFKCEILSTSMKSIGEVMGIGSTFEEAFLKSIRSLDININEIKYKIKNYSDQMIDY